MANPQPISGGLAFRCDALRIRSDRPVRLVAFPIDVVPKLESFILVARPEHSEAPRLPVEHQTLRAWIEPFWEKRHQLFIGAHRMPTPEWEVDGINGIVSEDTLVIRGFDESQLLVVADDEQPGTLIIAFDWAELASDHRKLDRLYVL